MFAFPWGLYCEQYHVRGCLLCEQGERGRKVSSWHFPRRIHRPGDRRWKRCRMSLIGKKPPTGPGSAGPASLPPDDHKSWPYLIEYLTLTRYDDGSPRETATLTIFVHDGQLKASLNDRACSRVGFLTVRSLEGLLSDLEAKLQADDLDWRPSNKPQGKRR